MTPGFWFAIAIIIFAILVFIVSVVNAYYYNRIRNSFVVSAVSTTVASPALPITDSEANTLFWINVIWAILALVAIGGAGYIAYLESRPVLPCMTPLLTPPIVAPVRAPLIAPIIPEVCSSCAINNPNRQLEVVGSPLVRNYATNGSLYVGASPAPLVFG